MINEWLDKLASEPETKKADRHEEKLDALSGWIADQMKQNRKISVNFICTHNSRRSQFAQVWFSLVQRWAGLEIADSFSGGTEVTACNERTIAALERVGLHITPDNPDSDNPVYQIFNDRPEPVLKLWSKVYDDPYNPSENFAAVMTCDHADQNCPFIPGASVRIPLTYTDPKYSDGTDEETQAYDLTCKQIASDMIRLIQKLKDQLPGHV